MTQNVSQEEYFILQRMIDGDESAFKYFFDTYYDDLCNFVNGYLKDEVLSEDIVQNIFVYLWERKDSLPANCSIKSYLYTASKNKSLNQLRNQKNKNKIEHDIFARFSLPSTEKADLFIEFEELKKIISSAIDCLPPKCRSVYELSRNEGMTNKEISEKLGITIKTVENQITIAIKKMKAFLQPYYDKLFIFFILVHFF